MRHRGGSHWGHDRGALSLPVLIALGAAAGGLVVGSILGLTGTVDLVGEDTPVALASEAPYYDCGLEDSIGMLVSGDRVFATGRDPNGEWIEIRSPHDAGARVWIRANQLTPDTDLALLPVVPCEEPAIVVVETTTTLPGDTTTTSVAVTTTTTVAATTTTLPPAPTVGTIVEQHDPIWEKYLTDTTYCSVGGPSQVATSLISAPITAAAGVDSVVMLWSVGGFSGQVTMSLSSGQYHATLGPFDAEGPGDVVPYPQESLPITVTVRVTDDLGRTASRQTTVTLNDCTFA